MWTQKKVDGAPAITDGTVTLSITDDEVTVNHDDGAEFYRCSFPRHVVENMLRTIAAEETKLLMANGWAHYGRHGYWHRPPGGASTTKGHALKMVREQLKEEDNVTDSTAT